MKKIRQRAILILIGLCSLSAGFSQTYAYVPMPEEFAVWGIDACGMGTFPIKYNVIQSGDTVINGLDYRKIYISDTSYTADTYDMAIREVNKIVYAVPQGSTTEYPISDFSKNIGDTVELYAMSYKHIDYGAPIKRKLLIEDIDTVSFGGLLRKRFHIGGIWEPGNETYFVHDFVEGIGSLMGVHIPFYPYTDSDSRLHCFYIEEDQIYEDQSPYCIPNTSQIPIPTGGCYEPISFLLPVTRPNPKDYSSFEIFPNPGSDQIYLELPDGQKMDFIIFNEIGEAVMEIKNGVGNSGFYPLNISSLPRGIYFITAKNQQNNHFSKFVKL